MITARNSVGILVPFDQLSEEEQLAWRANSSANLKAVEAQKAALQAEIAANRSGFIDTRGLPVSPKRPAAEAPSWQSSLPKTRDPRVAPVPRKTLEQMTPAERAKILEIM